jgi:hypothetical protein
VIRAHPVRAVLLALRSRRRRGPVGRAGTARSPAHSAASGPAGRWPFPAKDGHLSCTAAERGKGPLPRDERREPTHLEGRHECCTRLP